MEMPDALVYGVFANAPPHQAAFVRRVTGSPPLVHCELLFAKRKKTFVAIQGARSMLKNMDYSTYNPHVWTLVPFQSCTPDVEEALYRACERRVNRPYNYMGLYTFIIPLVRARYPANSLFCSEALAEVFVETGVFDHKRYSGHNIVPLKTSPTDFYHLFTLLNEV